MSRLPTAVPKPKPRPKKTRKPIRRSRVRQKAGKPKRFAKRRDPEYLAWIREQPCVLKGKTFPDGRPHVCWLPIEAAHIQSRGAGGGDHGNVVPCDGYEHAHQHTGGLKSWASYWFPGGLAELKKLAQQYTERYDRERSVG